MLYLLQPLTSALTSATDVLVPIDQDLVEGTRRYIPPAIVISDLAYFIEFCPISSSLFSVCRRVRFRYDRGLVSFLDVLVVLDIFGVKVLIEVPGIPPTTML